jgi:hypothetical protein
VDNAFFSLLDDLRRTRFRDLAGARLSAQLPLSAALLNRIAADLLHRTTIPIRGVEVRPLADDRFDLVVSATWPIVPPVTITLTVERQPVFPDSPALTLRWSLMAGFGAIASRLVSGIRTLPDGIDIQHDRIVLDIVTLARRSPAAEAIPYIHLLELHCAEGIARIDVELRVDGSATRTGD